MNAEIFDWFTGPAAARHVAAGNAARERQAQLLKPTGALGRLEALAIDLAELQGRTQPSADRVRIVLFAGDHGVADEGVSAYPQSVTAAMLRGFADGVSAVGVLARTLDAELEVIDLGTHVAPGPLAGVIDARLGPGTANFTEAAAMSTAQLGQALQIGRDAVERARCDGVALFIGGEMGISNTTAAAALAAAALQRDPAELVGPGTGLDAAGLQRKIEVLRRALALHAGEHPPLEILRRLGGFEIAALVGAYIACARLGLPALVDGFICGVAALLAERLSPGCRDWWLFAHTSAEPGHVAVLAALRADPLLHLNMRLGEGSGAAVALPLLRLACTLHNDMATFEEAAVAGKTA